MTLVQHYQLTGPDGSRGSASSLAPDASHKDILLSCLRDGVLLAYLLNSVQQNAVNLNRLNRSIDLSKLKSQHSKSLFEVNENLNMCVDAAKKLSKVGVQVVNLGASDVLEKNTDVVLGLSK